MSKTISFNIFLKNPFICLSIIVILFLSIFYKSFQSISAHGFTWHFLVPVISGYLIWITRKEILQNNFKPNLLLGISSLFISVFILFIGQVSSTLVISELALVFAIWSIFIYFGGFRLLHMLMWPLLYLLFISSATEGLLDLLNPLFRIVSAYVAGFMAKVLGFSILISNTYIRLPNMILNVANECSGVNHVISLTAITLPLAFLTQRKKWAVWVLILAAFPIALFSNSIRVLILIIINYNLVIFTHGPNNIFLTGFGFFIGLVLIFLLASILSKLTCRTSTQTNNADTSEPSKHSFSISGKTFSILSVALFCGSLFIHFYKIGDDIQEPDYTPLLSVTDGWTSQIASAGTELFDSFPLPNSSARVNYKNDFGSDVNLFIGWYALQTQNKEVAGHCFNRFFEYTGTTSVEGSNGSSYRFQICKHKKNTDDLTYLIAYRSNRYFTEKASISKLYTILDALLYKKTSASIIIYTLSKFDYNSGNIPVSVSNLISGTIPLIDKSFNKTN